MSAGLAGRIAAARLDWIVPAWQGPSRIAALFTTRNGGLSTEAAATMDLGSADPAHDPQAAAVAHNRGRLRALLPSEPIWLRQVHGRGVVAVDADNAAALRRTPPEADAALTRSPGLVLCVRTADCLPVLLSDRAGSVVAVAHAGWRGLARGVLEATLDAMQVAPEDVVGWIGPAIGPTAFEVGADVFAAFAEPDPGAATSFAPLREGKWLADLPGLARRRLAGLGVREVAVDGGCTFGDAARFHSYRRDRAGGRMALAAWLADAESLSS